MTINFRPFTLHKDVAFDYLGSIEEGVQLLSKSISRPSFRPLLKNALIGRISFDKIEIWLHRPLSNSFLTPWFIGKFEGQNGKTVLKGAFQFPKNIRIVFIFGIIAIIIFWAFVAIRDNKQSEVLLPLWCCLGSIALMFVALILSRVTARKDLRTIQTQIEDILQKGSI